MRKHLEDRLSKLAASNLNTSWCIIIGWEGQI